MYGGSLVEGAEKSEADRESAARTSCIGAIGSMYAFANGVSSGGPVARFSVLRGRLSS